jgi:hypothetical protein
MLLRFLLWNLLVRGFAWKFSLVWSFAFNQYFSWQVFFKISLGLTFWNKFFFWITMWNKFTCHKDDLIFVACSIWSKTPLSHSFFNVIKMMRWRLEILDTLFHMEKIYTIFCFLMFHFHNCNKPIVNTKYKYENRKPLRLKILPSSKFQLVIFLCNFFPLVKTKKRACIITTPKCILIHFGSHLILSELGHFYHGEIGLPPSERIVTYNELVH